VTARVTKVDQFEPAGQRADLTFLTVSFGETL
jgi:hypothetical protein